MRIRVSTSILIRALLTTTVVACIGVETGYAGYRWAYQGRLTGSGGNIVADSGYTITFSLWTDSAGGTQEWTETHVGVPVSSGLFKVVLGKDDGLEFNVLAAEAKYLQIQLDGEPPMTPRTRIHEVPIATAAGRVLGDIQTDVGRLVLKMPDSDSSIVMLAGTPEISAELYMIDPGDDGRLLELIGDNLLNQASIRFIDPGDNGHVMDFSSSPSLGGSIKMFNPQPEPPARVIELTSNDDGGSMTFFDTDGSSENSLSIGNGMIEMYFAGQPAFQLSRDALTMLAANCDPGRAGTFNTRVSACGVSLVDTTGDTMATVDVQGVRIGGSNTKVPGWDAFLMADSLKIQGGAAGYVMMSDATGVGTWQPLSAGSDNDWCQSGNVLRVCSQLGVASPTATLHGTNDSTHVNLGYSSTTGQEGSDYAFATVSGGQSNQARSDYTTVSGGRNNISEGTYAVISGGFQCLTDHPYAVVGGGRICQATGDAATVAGGWLNTASGYYSAVPGGVSNNAAGDYSLAAGRNANANHHGSIVLSANIDLSDSVETDNYEQIVMFAQNGLYLTNTPGAAVSNASRFINTSTGAYLTTGGTWTNSSSREVKENFETLDGLDVLEKVESLPMESWEYKGTSERHIWPCAEDFHARFNVGTVDVTGKRESASLAAGDVAGVALIGVQELYSLYKGLDEKSQRVEQLEARLAALEIAVEAMLAAGNTDQNSAKRMGFNRDPNGTSAASR